MKKQNKRVLANGDLQQLAEVPPTKDDDDGSTLY
jgi:hypothetical protein